MPHDTKTDAMKSILKYFMGNLQFFGDKALCKMNDNTVAEISLSIKGTSKKYPRMLVIIQNKESGEIARNCFSFDEYLERTNPTNNPHDKGIDKMHMWDNNETIDWYIVFPKTTKPICGAIFDYIEMYN